MSQNEIKILGIETSCDDSSLAILTGSYPSRPKILAHKSLSQIESLKEWGGVVPEIAARNHLKALPLLLREVLNEASLKVQDLDLMAVTALPGLLGPLLTGINFAKDLAMIHQKSLSPVNHLFAHMEAIHLSEDIAYPYLGLLVSGGHTLFLKVSSPNDFQVVGSTIDDAAGEAFDKGGKMMGLPYPAGPHIDHLAKDGNDQSFDFPIGLKNSKDARLSFSGIKADLRRKLEQDPNLVPTKLSDLAASYQANIVKALTLKTQEALNLIQEDLPIVVGGGVACNSCLRKKMQEKFKKVYFVKPEYCADNGAMVANYAYRTQDLALPYPSCLELDGQSRFINKKDFR